MHPLKGIPKITVFASQPKPFDADERTQPGHPEMLSPQDAEGDGHVLRPKNFPERNFDHQTCR
jgi:hypothetical protein